MMLTQSQIKEYLNRIGVQGAVPPTLKTLAKLQRAHLHTVPFENLSIFWGEPIGLDRNRLYRKIVERRRGGFCYELNSTFAWLLESLGFQVTLLSARVRNSNQEGFGPEFDHLVLKVDLEKPQLVDVGFGRSFMHPLDLESRDIQEQPDGRYRIREYTSEEGTLVFERWEEDRWKEAYLFTLIPRQLREFYEMCQYHQTSKESVFTSQPFCSMYTLDGRVTLADDLFIETKNGLRSEIRLADQAVIDQVLEHVFGIGVFPR